MTSSLALKKRKEMGSTWVFGNHSNPLGGMEDHYITPGHTHECHPNYKSHPIGNPYGFTVCVKRKGPTGRDIDQNPHPTNVSDYNGYHKYSSRLYDVCQPGAPPIQEWNPLALCQRHTPNEEYLIQKDYMSREFRYNGTGIKPMRTPGREDGRTFLEYGYSYTVSPPYKYDITRLEQPYPVWKNERLFAGESQDTLDEIDRTYNVSLT